MNKKYPKQCACCGQGEILESHMICDVCGWEDDSVQNKDPFYRGGANKHSLFEYEMIYIQKKLANKNYRSEEK